MKTLVNIITEDNPIPAYLFVKEMYEEGDSVMLISAKDTEDDLDHVSEIIGVPQHKIEEIVLKHDIDEFRYELICRTLRNRISVEYKYCVNLAGGTRYMALAVQQVFEDFNSDFYYVNTEDNQIILSKFDDNIDDNDDYGFNIKHRMSVTEYLDVHDMEHDWKRQRLMPDKPFEMAKYMFWLFTQRKLNGADFRTLEKLRVNYRNSKWVKIEDLLHPSKPNMEAIPNIIRFLKKIKFRPTTEGLLTQEDVEWLTGGWFEEYIYYIVQEAICPDDIVLGIHIWEKGVQRRNELDVSFTKNNKLFVIECKTGIESGRMFNEVVYKVCALREGLLGMSCNSFIFMLKDDNRDILARIAENMDIRLVDREILLDEQLLELEWNRIRLIACEQ